MADPAAAAVDAAARAAIRAQTQTAIGLNIPVFNGNKPYTIDPEQWIQRVTNAIAAGAWNNEQTIGFITTALHDNALGRYNALEFRGIDHLNWEDVKADFLATYGKQINAHNTCMG